jgi:hypothetical protein
MILFVTSDLPIRPGICQSPEYVTTDEPLSRVEPKQ